MHCKRRDYGDFQWHHGCRTFQTWREQTDIVHNEWQGPTHRHELEGIELVAWF